MKNYNFSEIKTKIPIVVYPNLMFYAGAVFFK